MGEKKAKKIQRKVSFPGVPGTGEALPGADSGRDQLRAGLWQKYGWLGTFLMGPGMCRKGLFLLCALPVCLFFLSRGYRWYGPQPSTLVLPSGGARKQKCGESQAHPLPLVP